MVDTGDIRDSDFGDFGVSYAPAQWMKDLGGYVVDGLVAAGEWVSGAADTIAGLAVSAIGALEAHGADFTFIGEAFDGLGNAAADLFSGDFAGALENADKALGALLDPDGWESIGNAVVGLVGSWGSSTSSSTDIMPPYIYDLEGVSTMDMINLLSKGDTSWLTHQFFDCGLGAGSFDLIPNDIFDLGLVGFKYPYIDEEFPENPYVLKETMYNIIPDGGSAINGGTLLPPICFGISTTPCVTLEEYERTFTFTNGAQFKLYLRIGANSYLDMQNVCNSDTAQLAKDYGCNLQFQFTQTKTTTTVCTYELCPL